MSKKTNQTLNKCDELIERLQELKKALGIPTMAQSNRKPVNGMGAGWSQDTGTGAFHHSTHGVISTAPHPEGGFVVKHGGGVVGRASNVNQAGSMIRDYVGSLSSQGTGSHNRPSPNLPGPTKMGKPTYKAEEMEKGPGFKFKGGSTYDTAQNVKRKANNVGDVAGEGKNVNVKAISTKPGQLSAKQQAAKTKFKGAAGPAKIYTPEQIAAINEANKLSGANKFKRSIEETPWVQHGRVPNADEELRKIQQTNPVNKAEDVMSNQLANMMQGRSMLGTPPPRQPTNEEMFGHLVPSEEEVQKAENAWSNRMNWLEEAMKPIASRFESPEEEEQYWNSIKVTDRDDGKPGY
jgi:hypothetical protein